MSCCVLIDFMGNCHWLNAAHCNFPMFVRVSSLAQFGSHFTGVIEFLKAGHESGWAARGQARSAFNKYVTLAIRWCIITHI